MLEQPKKRAGLLTGIHEEAVGIRIIHEEDEKDDTIVSLAPERAIAEGERLVQFGRMLKARAEKLGEGIEPVKRIIIGSKNVVKVEAVKEIAPFYARLIGADVFSAGMASGVSDQPLELEETIRGAVNRAMPRDGSDQPGDIYFGIESGLTHLPGVSRHTTARALDVCACAIWFEDRIYIGTSGGWVLPTQVEKGVLSEQLTMEEAMVAACLTMNPELGQAEGAIGVITKGKLDRKAYTKQAVQMALASLASLDPGGGW